MNAVLKENIGIIDQHLEKLNNEYNVKNIAIFGSVVKGKQTQKSDIDIMVEFSESIGFFKFIRLERFLSRILKRKVDLVTKNALKPLLKKNVLKEAVYV